MMPWLNENVAQVTTSQPPHKSAATRCMRSRLRNHTTRIEAKAAGNSQAIWPAQPASNMRCQLGVPQPMPPPTLPVSSPVILPRPL